MKVQKYGNKIPFHQSHVHFQDFLTPHFLRSMLLVVVLALGLCVWEGSLDLHFDDNLP